jgi:hypothetical protein
MLLYSLRCLIVPLLHPSWNNLFATELPICVIYLQHRFDIYLQRFFCLARCGFRLLPSFVHPFHVSSSYYFFCLARRGFRLLPSFCWDALVAYIVMWPWLTLYTHMVYIRYFQQGNPHTYGHIRCVYTVLASPTYASGLSSFCPVSDACTYSHVQSCTHRHTHTHIHTLSLLMWRLCSSCS